MREKKAVALRYNREIENAPRVVAKGEGYIADKIIKKADEIGIPIKEDKELVNLLSSIPLDYEIPPELYRAIAEIFAYLYKMSKK